MYTRSGATPHPGLDGNFDAIVDDIVFAGPLGNKHASMNAIRMSGGCKVIQPNEGDVPWVSSGVTKESFSVWCLRRNERMRTSYQLIVPEKITYYSCNTDPDDPHWPLDAKLGTVNALVWLNATVDAKGSLVLPPGIIECGTTFEVGTADLAGPTRTFSRFNQRDLYNRSAIKGRYALRHPLDAALAEITDAGNTLEDTLFERTRSVYMMLGFKLANNTSTEEKQWETPTLESIAGHLWSGAMHMGALLGELARQSEDIPAIEYRGISARIRDRIFIRTAAALLASWAVMLITCTMRMFRPTFASSLNSYTAGRLLAGQPQANYVTNHPHGDLEDNPNLRHTFPDL